MILRGLLNHKREDGSTMHPAWAIVISALFFGLIHANPWQALPAFMLGCLFGYVYYKTGSLKLTMLMHCVNNTLSTLLSRFGGEEVSQAKSLLDLMPVWEYILLFCISVGILIALSAELSKIELQRPQGNCDTVPSAGETFHADKFFS